MNLNVFGIHLIIMLLLQYALSKTLHEASETDSESEVSDSSDDSESIHETNHGFKHLKNDKLKGHNRRRRTNDENPSLKKQCAVMYKNDEPVGILQPFKDSYQFLPIHSDEQIPVEISPFTDSENSFKRDTSLINTEDDEDVPELGDETLKKPEESSQFSDERYPYIFAKFKVDSRIEKPDGSGINKPRTIHKRESRRSLLNGKPSDSLSSTLSRIRSNEDGAEVELRSILNDMGLIDDETRIDKRDAELNEDEDLEHGTNKINLIKLDNSNNNEERPKREELAEKPVKHTETATKHYEMIEIPEPKPINEEEYIDQYLNKHDEQPEQHDTKEIEKRSNEVAAEMEREIKSKLQKIKEEVRNEIDKLKSSNNEEFEDESEGNEQEQEEEKSQRRKRHVISSLVDEETSDINPVMSAENRLVPHVRRRRGIPEENALLYNKSENEEKTQSDTVSVNDTTETNLNIDLNSEVKGTPELDSSVTPHSVDGASGIIEPIDKNKPNQEKLMLLKTYDIIMDRINELENMGHMRRVTNIRSLKETLKGNFSDVLATSVNQYFATTEKPFLVRNLKQYDDEAIIGDDENVNLEENGDTNDKSTFNKDTKINRQKKSCKCGNGHKDCKCEKTPLKLLKGSDGSNFVYIDGVPRLANGPSFRQLSDQKEEHEEDKENPVLKMKLRPLPTDKKRSTKENLKYRKSRINFQKSLLDGGYTLDIDPDIYRITEENPKSLAKRRKRDSFGELVAIHGGGPVINHLVAIRERSMLPRVRVKRRAQDKNQVGQQLTLTDMSDEDLFGALPQNFEGELVRYKRVKRTN